MTDALPTTVQRALGDGYRMDRELGGGGMSRVFVAHDLALDRDIVVKVLSEEATAGVSAERFRREIQLIARLQHPNVVSILSAGAADGSLYYTMPFVTGETLRARIARQGALPVADAVRLLREVLDALDFAHQHGIVHRDIKPENVLVGASGHVVVADFGIAKALRESGTLTSAGFAIGTPQYMAPEQATADPTTDHRADLYSVGVLGYELLTGAPPFTGTAQQIVTQHLTTPPAPIASRRADVPDALADTITRALAKDPAARPQSAREMIDALDAVTTPAQRDVRRGSTAGSTSASSRRALPIAAAAVLALSAAGFFVLRSRPEAAPNTPPVAAGADLIAVMPLSAVSDSSLTRLGQDLVVTLSANLDGVGALQTVDAATLLMRARKLPSPLPVADARATARELGARSVLTGTLINEAGRVRASVTLHRVGSDSAIAKATVLAAPGDVTAITDSLTWSLLQQVWRRGEAPSPVLAGTTTRSVDALRAFLDAERHFNRLDNGAALAEYRRAFELDSNFAQAYLRYSTVNAWLFSTPDTFVERRLLELKDRLPERDRLALETSRASLPLPARLARWDSLVQRFPDYPPILMAAADPIIHNGPFYGIPMEQARPTLDRLQQLWPEHADTRFHQAIAILDIAPPDSIAATLASAARDMGSPWSEMFDLTGRLYAARARGAPLPDPEAALPTARAFIKAIGRGTNPYYMPLGTFGVDVGFAGWRLAALERVREAGIYSGDIVARAAVGEAMLQVSRGDWTGALRTLRPIETSSLSFTDRMMGARYACLGVWVDAVGFETADSTLARARAMPGGGATLLDDVELRWLDGLLGVTRGDEARVQRARRALGADTATAARLAARSLHGLWMARTNRDAGVDTLRAVSELAMRSGGFLVTAEGIARFEIGRALRQRGAPAEAERYLMWPDAATNVVRSFTVKFALSALVSYERALALEEAGDRRAAAFRLQRFLDIYDQPPPAHRALVSDARRRLAQLGATDAPARQTVAPR